MDTHPYTRDRWTIIDDPEHGVVRLADIYLIDRSVQAVKAIVRIVGNHYSDTEGAPAGAFNACTASDLMGGAESLCDHIATLTEGMLDQARESSRH